MQLRTALFVLLLAALGDSLAAGKDGPDLELICPCTVESASSSSTITAFGVLNRGSSATGQLTLSAYAHSDRDYFSSSTSEYLGELSITSSLSANSQIDKTTYQGSLNQPDEGTYYITILLLEDGSVRDLTLMSDQVSFGEVAARSFGDLYFVSDPSISMAGSALTLNIPAIGNSGSSDQNVEVLLAATENQDYFAEPYLPIGQYNGVSRIAAGSRSSPDTADYDTSSIPAEYTFYHLVVTDGATTLLLHTVRAPGVMYDDQSFNVTSADYLTDADGDGVADDNEKLMSTDPGSGSSTPGSSFIDVLAVYSTGTSALYNGDPSARLDHLIAVSNLALSDSGVNITVRLVASEELAMDTSQSISQWLNAAANGEGVFSNLQQSRTDAGADLITMFRPYDGLQTCGLATLGGFATQGFVTRTEHISASFIEFDQCGDITMIHEIGHNMGLGHSAQQDSTGTFIWSRGHGVTNSFATVMAYGSAFNVSDELPYFSNPGVSQCNGSPCGAGADEPAPADAARSLNAVRFQVANFNVSAQADQDGDGIPDVDDAFPQDANESVDTDSDGLGNNADRDDDNDGMPDRYEVVAGYDPLVDDANNDSDNNDRTNLEEYLALPKATQYLQNTTNSPNIARLHIVNTSEDAQRFTGTIFNLKGERLGSAYQSLGPEVPPKGRLILDSSNLESLFGVDPWKGPAMVEVVGSGNFAAMSKLVSRSGLISNTNCVRENRVLNIERYDPDGVTYVRLINTTENAMGSIRGTLYDSSGNIIGSADTELVSSLLPKEMVWINILQFEQSFGAGWDGEALLEVTEVEGLKLLNLNLINGETFFNFSCFEQGNEAEFGRVYLQTSTTGPNISMTHIVNTSDTAQQFTATMYNREGEQLGSADQVLGNAAAKGRVVVSTADLEQIFNTSPWKGPSMLEVSGTASFELMTKQTSRSGLVSNVNCVRQNQIHNIEGLDSSDITYIRFINISDTAISNVTGTLYDSNGNQVGPAGQTILPTLAPKEQTFINRNDLINIFDGATWNGEVMMEVEANDALRLLNLNFINNETFFNFSCYESANSG